jgi:alpha-glucoside transport system substrate-binding protein
MKTTSRKTFALASAITLAATLAACSSDTTNEGDNNGEGTAADCSAFEKYGDLSGKTVSVYTSIIAPEDTPHIESYKPFEECTGAKINYEGSKEFEAQLPVKLAAGDPPDIAFIPQPGLLQTIVQQYGDQIVPASAGTVENIDQYFAESWKGYGSVDGTFYAAPLGANVKSFVWYSPQAFAEHGYEVPETYDDLIALSDKIVEDAQANGTGAKPWCAGIGSGDATGWPATDWLEDMMLRTAGIEKYNDWISNDLKFDDPVVADALAKVGAILKNPDYVNGGIGNDVASIATTEFQDGGLPIVTSGLCFMHRQASFYAANWPEGTNVSPDGDVFAFYFPGLTADSRPVLGGGEFVAAFSEREEVAAFQAYLSSPEWSNARADATPEGGGWVSPNSGLDREKLKSDIDKLSFDLLGDTTQDFGFDGSDLMPGEVGAGSFWTEMTAWIAQDKSDEAVLKAIQDSWK